MLHKDKNTEMKSSYLGFTQKINASLLKLANKNPTALHGKQVHTNIGVKVSGHIDQRGWVRLDSVCVHVCMFWGGATVCNGKEWCPGIVFKDHLHWWHVYTSAGAVSTCTEPLNFHAYLYNQIECSASGGPTADACRMQPVPFSVDPTGWGSFTIMMNSLKIFWFAAITG